MTTTVTFKAVFGRQRDASPAPRARVVTEAPTIPVTAATSTDAPVSRLARQLALAYRMRALLDSGALPDQREAAARLGIVFPQMTHLLSLLYLAPDIQERILAGELVVGEAALREVARVPGWEEQRAALGDGLCVGDSRQGPRRRRRDVPPARA